VTPEEWREIKVILQNALELAPAAREAYLDSQPAAVRAEVRSLISSYEENSRFLAQPVTSARRAADEAGPGLVGKSFGPYRVLSLLGQGGMGSVWLAERVDGLFARRVALKLVHPVLMNPVMAGRVTREREILASLSHPNIARLFDAGFAQDGQPYLALEYIEGTPLTTYCDDRRVPLRARLELFRQVLGAVQYAHAHLVIHRDLKPSNILVTEAGQVSLLDFGIAKLLSEGEAKETELTRLGGRALTPDYAAPEQISGAPITTAADVYALGVMLYELVTGERPYRIRRSSAGALEEAILQAEPQAPSRATVSEATARARDTTVSKLAKALGGDLDTICLKALKKSPSERYATADAFNEDLARYLRGDPVLAHRDSIAYRTLKFARRHWVSISVAGVLLLTLAAGLAATSYEARVANAQRDAAVRAQLSSLTQAAAGRLRDGDVSGAMSVILEVLPRMAQLGPFAPEALGVFQEARAADDQVLALVGHAQAVNSAAFSPDGKRLVTASDDRTIRIWDADTGRPILLLLGHRDRVPSVVFSPDGQRVLTGSVDHTARLWDAASGRESGLLGAHTLSVKHAAFSPDGHRIATASSDRTARLWDADTGRELLPLTGHTDTVTWVEFSPDSTRVVTASRDHSVRIWNAASGKQLLTLSGHEGWVNSAAYAPDGTRIVTSSDDGSARLWDAASGRELRSLAGLTRPVLSALFAPDGRRIVTASESDTVRLFDAATGRQLTPLGGYLSRLIFAAFAPDGRRVVATSMDGTARVLDAARELRAVTFRGHQDTVSWAAFAPDGRRIATSSFDGTARIWDVATGQQLKVLSGHTDLVSCAAYSPDGSRVVTSSHDKTARIWDAATGEQLRVLSGHTAGLWCATYSLDGQKIATVSEDKTAVLWDAASGRQLVVLKGHTNQVLSAAFWGDGRRIVTASTDKTARIWDALTGQQLMVLSGHLDGLESVALSPDGRRIITASDDRTARIWDATTGEQLMVLSGHTAVVGCAVFSRDGRRIITASFDKTARIWDAATGQLLQVLSGHEGQVEGAAFAPDGRHVITTSYDKTARLWDVDMSELDVQIAWAQAAQFDPLTSADRALLGLAVARDVRRWPSDQSKCDQAAAAPYDPQRNGPGAMLEEIAIDVAVTACAGKNRGDPDPLRARYQLGRALMARGDLVAARRDFEQAIGGGYAAARVDLAMLLLKPGSAFDLRRAIELYEQAWREGVTIAGFELGSLYEHGAGRSADADRAALAPDSARAWEWYGRAAARGEPNALARFAERDDAAGSDADAGAPRDASLLEAFKNYAAASERARQEDIPPDAWIAWRYRRASLARVLARRGLMLQVAQTYASVRDRYAPRDSFWKRLTP
jgi:WD40 repeat protein/serine/threonine protein kinase